MLLVVLLKWWNEDLHNPFLDESKENPDKNDQNQHLQTLKLNKSFKKSKNCLFKAPANS